MPFIQTPNLNIHYEVGGTGNEVLLLVHGNFASWRWWRPVLERLPDGYRAYTPDLRGCGDTEQPSDGYTIEQLAADLLTFADTLDLSPLHLVGHSLGGAVALQFALNNPNRVKSLLLVAPAPAQGLSFKVSAPSLSLMSETRRNHSLEMMEGNYRLMRTMETNRPLLQKALSRMAPRSISESDFRALVDDAARMAPEAMVGYLQTLDAWNVQADLHKFDGPALILWGARDKIVPLEALYRTARGLPQGNLLKWDDVGHAPQLEQPDRFVKMLFDFIEQKVILPGAAGGSLKAKIKRWWGNAVKRLQQ